MTIFMTRATQGFASALRVKCQRRRQIAPLTEATSHETFLSAVATKMRTQAGAGVACTSLLFGAPTPKVRLAVSRPTPTPLSNLSATNKETS